MRHADISTRQYRGDNGAVVEFVDSGLNKWRLANMKRGYWASNQNQQQHYI